jgi:hypothetical protein
VRDSLSLAGASALNRKGTQYREGVEHAPYPSLQTALGPFPRREGKAYPRAQVACIPTRMSGFLLSFLSQVSCWQEWLKVSSVQSPAVSWPTLLPPSPASLLCVGLVSREGRKGPWEP